MTQDIVINRYLNSVVAHSSVVNKKGTQGRKKKLSNIVEQVANEVILQNVTRAELQNVPHNDLSTVLSDLRQKCISSCEQYNNSNKIPIKPLPESSYKFNKKNYRTIKKLTELINLFYEKRNKAKKLYWVTITTVQHKTQRTDKDLFYGFKLWKQHSANDRFVCVVERQRDTQDIHFHCIVERFDNYNINDELNRISRIFGVVRHPALFTVKQIYSAKTLVSYISKYVRKPCPNYQTYIQRYNKSIQENKKPKIAYSSRFECRTFSYSGSIGKVYKSSSKHFKRTTNHEIINHYPNMFKIKYQTDYFTVYEYSKDLWKLFVVFNKMMLESKKLVELKI